LHLDLLHLEVGANFYRAAIGATPMGFSASPGMASFGPYSRRTWEMALFRSLRRRFSLRELITESALRHIALAPMASRSLAAFSYKPERQKIAFRWRQPVVPGEPHQASLIKRNPVFTDRCCRIATF
jgi:hypothetical protein